MSGAAVAAVAFEAARRRSRPDEVALLLGLTRIGVLLVAVGTLLVLPFGLWLVSLEHVGYGAAWVDSALALLGVTVVLGAVGGRRPKQARLLAARLAREGGDDEQLRPLLDDRASRAANYVSALLVLAIVVLMVVKPG